MIKKLRSQPWAFLFAFALPPKISTLDYDWAKNLRTLPQRQARGVEKLSADPVLDGNFILRNGRLVVLSPDRTQIQERGLARGELLSSRAATPEIIQKTFNAPEKLGEFKADADRLNYLDLWSIEMGYQPIATERVNGRGPLLAFALYPPRLFYLGESLRQAYRIGWSEESEVLRYWMCDRVTPVVAENLKNGLSRLFFFRAERPATYTVFDFSKDERLSDSSAVVSTSCSEFYFAGSFGITRVRY